jgi:peptidyl-prolyl cis-trans isomerase A (cyclophilin A)
VEGGIVSARGVAAFRWTRVLMGSVLVAALSACGGGEEAPEAAPDTTAAPPAAEPPLNPLLYPTEGVVEAPDTFRVRFATNEGDFVVQVVKAWAPVGATRFYNLVQRGYYDQARFYRAIQGFMVQFGMHADPQVTSAWRAAPLQDDPVTQSNARGYITYAKSSAPNSRTTQLFINLVDNYNLDASGFAPFGRVVEGMEVVDRLYTGYGEGAPTGRGPGQAQIQTEGNTYLMRDFPELDFIERATIEG